jgi:hypothetical protein
LADILTVILDILLWIPFAWGLLLAGSFVGWSFFGKTGAMAFGFAGFVLGLVIDFSEHWAAKYLRYALAFAAVILMMVAYFK